MQCNTDHITPTVTVATQLKPLDISLRISILKIKINKKIEFSIEMSRNYDELTTIPFVNSTMQEDFEGDHYRHIDKKPSSCPPGDEDIELEYRELEVELEHLQLDSDYSDSRSLAQFKQNKNSNKKVFKSFQEKYPISMPEMSYFSKSSSSFVDNNFYEYDEDSKVSPRMKVNRREMSHKDFSKQDLHKIYQELNVIHNKLVVSKKF